MKLIFNAFVQHYKISVKTHTRVVSDFKFTRNLWIKKEIVQTLVGLSFLISSVLFMFIHLSFYLAQHKDLCFHARQQLQREFKFDLNLESSSKFNTLYLYKWRTSFQVPLYLLWIAYK